MDKKELNELFGIAEDDSQEGVVDPKDGDVTDGGTDPKESDEPEEKDLDEEELEEEDELEEGDVEGTATPQQTPAENSAYAAARKAAEAELRGVKQDRDLLLETLNSMGYEGSIQEIIDAIKAQADGKEISEVIAEREADERRIAEALENHPDIIAARAAKRETIAQQQAAEFARIQAKNPDIRSIGELMNLDGNAGTAFRALVKDGMHIDKAYEAIEGMLEKKALQAKPDTKAHIKQVNGTKTEPAGEIPRKQLELAQALMPSASKKEIQEYFERYAK